jgi:hypothetical protein
MTPKWAFGKILEFLNFEKERVDIGEISPATLAISSGQSNYLSLYDIAD